MFLVVVSYLCLVLAVQSKRTNSHPLISNEKQAIPNEYNLADRHTCPSLHTIRNGSTCGASWMFASSGAYADSLCHTKNISILPSPQFQINCDTSCAPYPHSTECNNGCSAGYLFNVAKWLGERGIAEEKCISYKNKKETCALKCDNSNKLRIHSQLCHAALIQPTVELMQRVIMKYGSLLVGIRASPQFMKYRSGVYAETDDSAGFQALKVIGWNETEEHQPYWIVENSWGEDWGLKGRAYVKRGANSTLEEEVYFFPPCEDLEWISNP